MSESLELYGFGNNDRSGKVRWVAEELGLTIEERMVRFGEHRQPPYTNLNPLAQIPTVRWRGRVLMESTAICQTLAEAFDAPKLWVGRGEPARDTYLYWLAAFAETLEGRLVECAVSKNGILGPEFFQLHAPIVRFKLAALALRTELVDPALVMPYVDRLRARPAAERSKVFASLG